MYVLEVLPQGSPGQLRQNQHGGPLSALTRPWGLPLPHISGDLGDPITGITIFDVLQDDGLYLPFLSLIHVTCSWAPSMC